jgi:hypothetical protein
VTRRRKLLFVGAAIATLAVVVSLPRVYWPLVGWWRGEPFYLGMPASYWAGEVSLLSAGYELVGQEPRVECYRADCLFPGLRRRFGMVVPSRLLPEGQVPLGQGDPAAMPVLLALLHGPDNNAQLHAAWALAKVGPAAREALPELTVLAARRPRDATAAAARDALRYIRGTTGQKE